MTSSDDPGAHLSIDERISLLSGEGYWHSASVPQLVSEEDMRELLASLN